MIPNDALIKALRELNFTFKRQSDRVMLWKHRGSARRVEIRRHDLHDPTYARTLLRQAGMPADQIEKFIQSVDRNHH